MTSSYDAYIDYFALRNHFNSSYDYIKYKGKLRRSQEVFEKRKDKWIFEKLAKRQDYHKFLLANLSRKPKLWITDIVGNNEAEIRYVEWKKIQQSMGYIFEHEIQALPVDMYRNIRNYHRVVILNEYYCKNICLETLCILSDLTGHQDVTPFVIQDNPVWKELLENVRNYTPFIKYDKAKMRALAYRHFEDPVFSINSKTITEGDFDDRNFHSTSRQGI